jgi:hypothetical protein
MYMVMHLSLLVSNWSTDRLVLGISINQRYVCGNKINRSPTARYLEHSASRDKLAIVLFADNTLTVETVPRKALLLLRHVLPYANGTL